MNIDLEPIRSANPIETLIREKYPLRRSGARFVGVEHDSLVVTPQTGFYFWNSRDEHGDVFDFVGRHLLGYDQCWNNRDPALFLEAVRYLAQRAGISVEAGDFRRSYAWAERQLIQRLHEALFAAPDALEYVTQKRGWDLSTVKAARLGFMPQDKRPLLSELHLSDQWRRAISSFPARMLVYVHLDKGRLVYLSGRSIEGKQHYNPPRELMGERQPYYNHLYSANATQVAVVEGQADAITFGLWDVPAIAVAGMHISDHLFSMLRRHRRIFVTLDNTAEAMEKSREIAHALGKSAFIPRLPDGVKDANDWLVHHRVNTEDAAAVLNKARSWLETEIERVAFLTGLERKDALRALFQEAVDLDEMELGEFRAALAKQGVKGRTFNDLLKAARTQETANAETDVPQILSDDVPLLSPALGFQRDVAIVTVAVIERTKDKKLNTQPYLVTSTRELRRLSDEQIIVLNHQEVALRVIPEGCEFLMRWRFADIQRYLQGEIIEPGAVFTTIHDLFNHYVDFRSPVESRLLTLWTIGTYFYTMFPAYPYLALNGPKNSGKSTVMRVLQPLAFNMVTTSDPTGPSMFRLIHYTSCTVGIDEAERYHNPKDPGMQQIRQLLNSGYKQGMPAIRLIGEDMKPQAFDVYSPKILAAIAGLEDILASRCIPVPMRRTDKQMPTFPPDFDGASIRHALYSLALTHSQPIYHNYFERPELHSLHNRSGELWSPLIALAAFFDEVGHTEGLLETVMTAATSDQQLSEGKALSDREEAVLQALELITHGEEELVWIKAAALRERVARLIGQSVEKMGDAQWIGHILKRLHLLDDARRKRGMDGVTYAVKPSEVLDMMRRYDVAVIRESR